DGQGDRQVNRGPPTIGNETRQQVHFAEPNHSPQSDPSAPHGGERRHADRENCDDEPPRLAVRSVVGPRVRIPCPLRLDYRNGLPASATGPDACHPCRTTPPDASATPAASLGPFRSATPAEAHGPDRSATPARAVDRTRPPVSVRASTRSTGPVFGPLMLAC